MKIHFTILLILVCGLSLFGQQIGNTEPRNGRGILNFPKSEQMFQTLEGKWIFADMTCAEPYTVTVAADRKSIKFQYAKPQKWEDGIERDSFTYKVLAVGGYFIRAQIEGESRKTDEGSPVAWDFMFLSPNEFVWHRTDWEGLNSTKPVTRCDDGKVRAFPVIGSPRDSKPPGSLRVEGAENSISGGVLNGKAVTLAKPEYSPAARAVRAAGAVNVQVTIDEQGNIISASAISGHPLLRQSAEKAAFASKFAPTTLEGQPVQVTGIIVYNFVP
jgi:TonB family protein